MPEPKSRHAKLRSIAPFLRVKEGGISYQAQLRSRIIDAISSGVFVPGTRMPSSRALASELGLARNTIILAYQHLVAEGHLQSRERSGYFVAERSIQDLTKHQAVSVPRKSATSPSSQKMTLVMDQHPSFRSPPDWHSYRFPFLEGQYDQSLFPVAEWREASRMALGVREVAEWSTDIGEADDEFLVDEIRRKLLPRRGITAERDEILITVGEQQALSLLSMLFVKKGTRATVEDPGLPEMRDLLSLRGAQISHQPIDDNGMIVDSGIGDSDLVYVSPSRQRPTGVTLPLDRRLALIEKAKTDDFLIIEDDFECEMNYLSQAVPAIRSLDDGQRVLYVASLSKVLAPGLRLGFLVAPAEVIAAARRLRHLTTRRPSPNNQRTAAFFLSLGHYDTMLARLAKVYEERLLALRDALNHYRPLSIAIPPVAGGTSYWMRGPAGLDGPRLVKRAEALGVLIEPAAHYFADPIGRQNTFRLGVTSLPSERIRPGIAQLARAMTGHSNSEAEEQDSPALTLSGKEAAKRLSGARLLYKTVYGEPCTISLRKDGTMHGRAGYANEDRDNGRWWIEGDLWHRQWDHWAYGEVAAFRVEITGNLLHWVGEDGRRVDQAVIAVDKQDQA